VLSPCTWQFCTPTPIIFPAAIASLPSSQRAGSSAPFLPWRPGLLLPSASHGAVPPTPLLLPPAADHQRPFFLPVHSSSTPTQGATALVVPLLLLPWTAAAPSLALRCVELRYCTSPMLNSSPSASRARLAALARVVSQ
jgi:hypothetical protein